MKTKHALFVACGFLVVYAILATAIWFSFPNMEVRGQFGDMFGALNALFSGAALLGIVLTILLQKEELGLQRKELELTRAELRRAAEAQERSQQALSRQAASLRVTAKLNGLSAELNYHGALIQEIGARGGITQRQRIRAEAIIGEIQELIGDKHP